jgi:hypothetical protein
MGGLTRNPAVECTELADGAVLLNMDTRLYYSLNLAGLELWNATEGASGSEQVAERLTEALEVDQPAALEAVSRFLPELEREGLVVEASQSADASAPPAASPNRPRAPFEQPQLIKHDEPLHDVANTPFDPQLPLAE